MTAAGAKPLAQRLTLGLLMVVMAVGSLALWTVVPGAALWLTSLPGGIGRYVTPSARHSSVS